MTTEKQDPLAELMQLADMHAYAKVTASFPREKLPRNQLFALAQSLTTRITELEAQLDAVGAGGVSRLMPAAVDQVACGECGATHRPGENTLCPSPQPAPERQPLTDKAIADIQLYGNPEQFNAPLAHLTRIEP